MVRDDSAWSHASSHLGTEIRGYVTADVQQKIGTQGKQSPVRALWRGFCFLAGVSVTQFCISWVRRARPAAGGLPQWRGCGHHLEQSARDVPACELAGEYHRRLVRPGRPGKPW